MGSTRPRMCTCLSALFFTAVSLEVARSSRLPRLVSGHVSSPFRQTVTTNQSLMSSCGMHPIQLNALLPEAAADKLVWTGPGGVNSSDLQTKKMPMNAGKPAQFPGLGMRRSSTMCGLTRLR